MYVCESAESTEILAAAGVLLVHSEEAEAGRRLVPTKRLLRVSECMRLKSSGWFMLVIMLGRGKLRSMGMFTWTMLWVGHACAVQGVTAKRLGIWAVARDAVQCGRARCVFQGFESLHARDLGRQLWLQKFWAALGFIACTPVAFMQVLAA